MNLLFSKFMELYTLIISLQLLLYAQHHTWRTKKHISFTTVEEICAVTFTFSLALMNGVLPAFPLKARFSAAFISTVKILSSLQLGK